MKNFFKSLNWNNVDRHVVNVAIYTYVTMAVIFYFLSDFMTDGTASSLYSEFSSLVFQFLGVYFAFRVLFKERGVGFKFHMSFRTNPAENAEGSRWTHVGSFPLSAINDGLRACRHGWRVGPNEYGIDNTAVVRVRGGYGFELGLEVESLEDGSTEIEEFSDIEDMMAFDLYVELDPKSALADVTYSTDPT